MISWFREMYSKINLFSNLISIGEAEGESRIELKDEVTAVDIGADNYARSKMLQRYKNDY